MGASYDPSGVYATLHYDYVFGKRITPDQLGFDLGVQGQLERLTEGFAGATTPVYVGGGAVYLAYDDRPADRTAMGGFGFNSYAAVGVPLIAQSMERRRRLFEDHSAALRPRPRLAPARRRHLRCGADSSSVSARRRRRRSARLSRRRAHAAGALCSPRSSGATSSPAGSSAPTSPTSFGSTASKARFSPTPNCSATRTPRSFPEKSFLRRRLRHSSFI